MKENLKKDLKSSQFSCAFFANQMDSVFNTFKEAECVYNFSIFLLK